MYLAERGRRRRVTIAPPINPCGALPNQYAQAPCASIWKGDVSRVRAERPSGTQQQEKTINDAMRHMIETDTGCGRENTGGVGRNSHYL